VALSGDLLTQRFGLTGLPSVLSRVWLIWCFSELGAFTEAGAEADEAARIAAAVDHPFDLMVASFGGGIMHVRRGDIPRAVTALEESLRLCRVGNIPFWFPFVACSLGFVYALAGRHAEALPLIDAAEAEHAGMRLMGGHALLVSWQSEAYALAGRLDEAARHAARALDLAQKYGEAGHRAYALRALATAEALRDPRGAGAGQYFAQALAASDGLAMRPLSACCRLGLGEAQRRRGERGPAAEHLEAARAAFEALRMPFWLERAERELAALG
jgi:tetratricopeptide (TPR) repeat protein